MNKAAAHVWEIISFPEKSLLAKRVPKKQFLESGQLVSSDKKLFRENVKSIYWQYTLKPSTCSVLPYRDHEREYPELAVLQIEVGSPKGHRRIAEVIHRVIPYPLMLGFFMEPDRLSLSIAPKRFSQSEQGAFVADRFFTTDWMDITHLNESESAFMDSLNWNKLPLTHYGALYNAWVDRFIGYECAIQTGLFIASTGENRLNVLDQCRQIKAQIEDLRNQLKKSGFKQQVELNMQIKKLDHRYKQLKDELYPVV